MAVTISCLAAHWLISARLRAAAIKSRNWSGAQAKAGAPRFARASHCGDLNRAAPSSLRIKRVAIWTEDDVFEGLAFAAISDEPFRDNDAVVRLMAN